MIPTLYHYTTQAGLLGILQENAIWATDIRYFNDSREIEFALDETESAIDEVISEAEPELFRALEKLRLHFSVHRLVATMEGPFVVAFCPDRNRLSQWRAYTGDCGYAIGFEFDLPPAHFVPPEIQLISCSYDTHELRSTLDSFISDFLEVAHTGEPAEIDRATMGFGGRLGQITPRFKHPGFREEEEWRLIVREPFVGNRFEKQLRPGRSSLVPFYRIPFTLDGHRMLRVKEIVVGPSPQQELAMGAVRDLLISTDLADDVTVAPSDIPFRRI